MQGEVAVYVRQEGTMTQQWVLNEKFKERWLNKVCIEMNILEGKGSFPSFKHCPSSYRDLRAWDINVPSLSLMERECTI